MESMPKDIDGRSPTINILQNWITERGWYQRKDILDARVSGTMDDDSVAKKIMMLDEQAAAMREVRIRATEYLIDKGFDSSASAVSALIKASQEERKSRGMSRIIEQLASMDEDEIMQKIKELTERAGSEIIDVSEQVVVEEDA